MPFEGIGASVRRKEDCALPHRPGPTPTTSTGPASSTPSSCARPHAHARSSAIDTAAAARRRAWSRSSPARTSQPTTRRHPLRLADPQQGRLADGGAAASGAGGRQGAPRRRSGRRGDRRDAAQAKDAAEPIDVDYEELPAVVDAARRGRARRAARCTTMRPATSATTGTSATRRRSTPPSPRRRKSSSSSSSTTAWSRTRWSRAPRSANTTADSGDYTLYTTSQNPHVIRLLMGAFVLHIPEHKLRVVAPDVGGGFGSKIFHYAEEAIVTWAAGKVRPPGEVDRRAHARASCPTRTAATTSPRPSWRSTPTASSSALRVATLANMGAYLSTFAPCVPTYLYATLLAGVYKTPADLLRGEGGVHQHRAGRRLSRRRPAGGDLPARAAGRQGGARDWDRPGRDPPEELHPDRRLPLPDAGRAAVRQRRLPRDAGRGAEGGRLRRLRGAPGARPRRGASCAASASPPTSRPAASRPRRWSARSAPAPASTRWRPSACIRPAASPCFTGTHSHGQGHETTFAQLVARPARRADGAGRHRPRRHRQDPLRHGHLRLPRRSRSAARRWSRRWTRSSPRARRSPPT